MFLDTFSFFVLYLGQNFAVGSQALFGKSSALPRPWDFLSVVAAKRTTALS